MRLDSFSGRSSFGLSLELMTEHLSTAFSLLKDLVFDPTFPQEEIGTIKEDMKAVIRQRDDDIFQSTAHVLKETLFQTHPFRLETEGTLESVEAINREDILAFYDQFAVSRNMVLSVFGDIRPENILKDIEQIFGAMKDRNTVLQSHEENPPHEVREQALTMDKEQAMVMVGFQGVKLGDADYHGLEVLTTILGSSFNGRIFTNIREQLGEAYTLGGNFVPSPDMGLIYFYVLTTDKEVDKVKELLKKEIHTLQTELVSVQELKDVKTYLKGTFKASQETNADLSITVSLDELYGLGFENYQHYDSRIDGVTEEDIRRLAQQYLDFNKMAVAVTRPNNSSDE
jgi:zinc protease